MPSRSRSGAGAGAGAGAASASAGAKGNYLVVCWGGDSSPVTAMFSTYAKAKEWVLQWPVFGVCGSNPYRLEKNTRSKKPTFVCHATGSYAEIRRLTVDTAEPGAHRPRVKRVGSGRSIKAARP